MINWKVRFQNKTFFVAFCGVIASFVYCLLSLFGVAPPASENIATELAFALINLLTAAGIVIDPTTQGISDSAQALEYQKPKEDLES